jgi:hypothetical protein
MRAASKRTAGNPAKVSHGGTPTGSANTRR